jgi:hypothetical protein
MKKRKAREIYLKFGTNNDLQTGSCHKFRGYILFREVLTKKSREKKKVNDQKIKI